MEDLLLDIYVSNHKDMYVCILVIYYMYKDTFLMARNSGDCVEYCVFLPS